MVLLGVFIVLIKHDLFFDAAFNLKNKIMIYKIEESEQNIDIEVESSRGGDGIYLHLCEYSYVEGKKGAITTENHVINVTLSESQCLELIKALQLSLIDSVSIKK